LFISSQLEIPTSSRGPGKQLSVQGLTILTAVSQPKDAPQHETDWGTIGGTIRLHHVHTGFFFNDMCNAQSDNFSTTNLASPSELHTPIGMSQLLSCRQNTAFDTAGSVRELLRF
jgi:hypothetical protein